MITFININAVSFSVFFQLPSPPLLLLDNCYCRTKQFPILPNVIPKFLIIVWVFSKVYRSKPRTLESYSTNTFEDKSESVLKMNASHLQYEEAYFDDEDDNVDDKDDHESVDDGDLLGSGGVYRKQI